VSINPSLIEIFYVYNICVLIYKKYLICRFLAHLALGHVSYCHHFSSVVCRPSVNISHCNLLLRNHWANCNQTLVEWSLDGPLPKLCPVIPTSNQDGRLAKNRKKGDEILIVHCCFSTSKNELKF
jgi:hypothetical protein